MHHTLRLFHPERENLKIIGNDKTVGRGTNKKPSIFLLSRFLRESHGRTALTKMSPATDNCYSRERKRDIDSNIESHRPQQHPFNRLSSDPCTFYKTQSHTQSLVTLINVIGIAFVTIYSRISFRNVARERKQIRSTEAFVRSNRHHHHRHRLRFQTEMRALDFSDLRYDKSHLLLVHSISRSCLSNTEYV